MDRHDKNDMPPIVDLRGIKLMAFLGISTIKLGIYFFDISC
jgi:hypothetical protein